MSYFFHIMIKIQKMMKTTNPFLGKARGVFCDAEKETRETCSVFSGVLYGFLYAAVCSGGSLESKCRQLADL